jgi:hypothetical protein
MKKKNKLEKSEVNLLLGVPENKLKRKREEKLTNPKTKKNAKKI